MAEEVSAGAVVYFKDGKALKFLLLHYEEGHLDFPKGHVIVGEKIEEAALREIKEETGLTVSLSVDFRETYAYTYKNKENIMSGKRVYFFIGESQSKETRLSDEHIGYAWLSYEHALGKLTYDNAKDVLKKANEFLGRK